MKHVTLTIALALAAAAPLPSFAGRDQGQILLQDRANTKAFEMRTQAQAQMREGRAVAGPAGDTAGAKEGAPGNRQLELLKRFHPKHVYGY